MECLDQLILNKPDAYNYALTKTKYFLNFKQEKPPNWRLLPYIQTQQYLHKEILAAA